MFYKHFTAIQIYIAKGDLESDICFVEGDIKIEGSCIFQTVIAYGDIHIHEECEVDMLISIHGNIVIDGPTKGELYRGQELCFGESKLCSCSTIPQAHSSFRWNY